MSLTKNFTGSGNEIVCFGIFIYDSNQELTLDIKLSLPPGKQSQVITHKLLKDATPGVERHRGQQSLCFFSADRNNSATTVGSYLRSRYKLS